ncbi:hypothetical protein P7K49_039908 [Saguinus oedipus]|uniref:Uncharacterized protein n=1 Tax=Saguinus oedipus TaxID=9490 RepID=A0ABQ9TCE4_SAGOE|nr:hypothetical protein P7K49_039908 [Saguinus oedipus]
MEALRGQGRPHSHSHHCPSGHTDDTPVVPPLSSWEALVPPPVYEGMRAGGHRVQSSRWPFMPPTAMPHRPPHSPQPLVPNVLRLQAPTFTQPQAQACLLLQETLSMWEVRLCFLDPEWKQLIGQVLTKVMEVIAGGCPSSWPTWDLFSGRGQARIGA